MEKGKIPDNKENKKKASKKTAKKINDKRFNVNSKEFSVNLEQLQKDVKKAYDSMRKIVPEAIKNTEIKQFGNASHIILPKEYAGKKATVIIKETSKKKD